MEGEDERMILGIGRYRKLVHEYAIETSTFIIFRCKNRTTFIVAVTAS